ncbi:hypothetical protein ACNOYE_06620 [Nannocystaceae bacterium ST9]
MLTNISVESIHQRCDACGATRELPRAGLRVGVESPRDPNIIELPHCHQCGSREFLNRVVGTDPRESSDGAEHRRAVNALHAALVAAGQAAPSLVEWFAREAIVADVAVIPWTFSGARINARKAGG